MFVIDDRYIIDTIHKVDAGNLSKLMSSNYERFYRYFPKTLEQNLSEKASKIFIEQKISEFDARSEFLFTLRDKENVIGLIYIKELDWSKKQGEFAYCIGARYTGKGLISKSITLLSTYAFNNLGLEVLQIMVHKDNVPSVGVAKNGGFIWQKTISKSYSPPNEEPLDMELYELYKNKDER